MVLPFPFKGKRINRQYPSIIWQCIEGHPYKILSVPKGTHPASKLSQRFYLRCCKSNHQKKKKETKANQPNKNKRLPILKVKVAAYTGYCLSTSPEFIPWNSFRLQISDGHGHHCGLEIHQVLPLQAVKNQMK